MVYIVERIPIIRFKEKNMELTKEQESRVDDWLDETRILHKCLACEANKFNRNDWKIVFLQSKPHITDPLGETEPCLSIKCSNCGYIFLFSAKTVGITE